MFSAQQKQTNVNTPTLQEEHRSDKAQTKKLTVIVT